VSTLLTAGPWRLEAEPARGSAGLVYRARHSTDDRVAAVKVMSWNEHERARAAPRFRREIATLRAIEHENVVRVLDDGALEDGRLYLAMEWLDGGTLAERLRRGRLPGAEALAVVDGVAAALTAAHAAGVVHRDLKAQNVMLACGRDEPITVASVRLVDFGVAFDVSSSERLTSTGMEIGTPLAMSPEQRAGQTVGPGADVYAFGVLIHELFAGVPLSMPTASLAPQATPVASLELPPELEPTVMRCLADDPSERGGAAEVARAVRRALQGGEAVARVGAVRAPALVLLLEHPAEGLEGLRESFETRGWRILFEGDRRLVLARLLASNPGGVRDAATALVASLPPGTKARRAEGDVEVLRIDGVASIVGGELLAMVASLDPEPPLGPVD
jgi:serine/threonine protein kinase